MTWFDKIIAPFGLMRSSLQAKQAQQMAQKLLAELARQGDVPPTGRSSKEEPVNIFGAIASFNSYWDGLDHVLPLEVLDFIVRVGVINPDLNHATTNLVNMANNGHNLVIEAASDSVIERAHARLDEKARTLYTHSAGIDGLVNHYIEQILTGGAVSSEDVISPKLDGVERVVIVAPRRIRFEYENDRYAPRQKIAEGTLIPLNPLTYKYYAFRTVENSPYGIPLYAAAVEAIARQQDMNKNIAFIMKKLGLLGLVSMAITPPRARPNELDAEYNSRLATYLENVTASLGKNWYEGLMVHFKDMEPNMMQTTGNADGSKQVWDINQKQIASGAGLDGGVIGESWHVTDAFANVVYRYFIGQVNNIRRLPKRRMEATYRLDLQLGGIKIDNLSLQFHKNPARDPQAEAQAEATRNADIIRKVKEGAIDPDTAAQEMGYDEWFDHDRIGSSDQSQPLAMLQRHPSTPLRMKGGLQRVFRYKQELQRYEFVRPSLGRISANLISEEAVRETLRKFGDQYLAAIQPYIDSATDDAMAILEGILRRAKPGDYRDADAFAEAVFASISSAYVGAFESADSRKAIRDSIDTIYSHYRLQDSAVFASSPGIQFSFDTIDQRTLGFMQRVDRFYLSKWIYNEPTEKQVLDFMKEQYLAYGEGLFGRGNQDTIDTVIALSVDRLEPLTRYEANRIVDTAVQRMRNWGNIGQLDEAGFRTARYYNPSPEAEICKWITTPPNDVMIIADARQAVDELSQLSPQAYADKLKQGTLDNVRLQGVNAAVQNGLAIPPLHPHCHTRLLAGDLATD